MEYAIQLLVPLMLGIFGGIWLDKVLHTAPLFTILGLICGMVLGIGVLYKRALMEQKQRDEDKAKKDGPT
jgi:F0F1-type ATP synthase assembly protein I